MPTTPLLPKNALPKEVWCMQAYQLVRPQAVRPPSPSTQPVALTIGNFDGLHVGHQALLAKVVALAKQLHVTPALLTFSPHPASVLGGQTPALLTTRQHMLQFLHKAGLEWAYFVHFHARLAQLEARPFVQQGLQQHFALKGLVVGEGFRFGQGRYGDANLLRALCQPAGIEVRPMKAVRSLGGMVSSSRIRQSLSNVQFEEAAALLGRPYGLLSTVIEGRKQGRTLGFATINMAFEQALPLPHGVYAVRAKVGKRWYDGVSNYGLRPTLTQGTQALLETHVFGFAQTVYRAWVEVRPLHQLRPEKRFESLEALKQGIAKDCEQAKAWLSRCPHWANAQEDTEPVQPFT